VRDAYPGLREAARAVRSEVGPFRAGRPGGRPERIRRWVPWDGRPASARAFRTQQRVWQPVPPVDPVHARSRPEQYWGRRTAPVPLSMFHP
jgi:hypothetical protein